MRDTRLAPALAALLTLTAFGVGPSAADGVTIKDLVIAAAIPDAQRDAELKAARAFYDFWNTGDETYLKQAMADGFVDHTLPPGRPQGPTGPAFASHNFRGAVPDLHCEVEKMIVAGDYVTVHMQFTGHFTGKLGGTAGKGQAIAFIATDLIKITDGRVTDNWHIEDNLTLLTQMGIARVGP